MSRAAQIDAFLAGTAFSGGELRPLAGDASFRRYIRVQKDGRSAMLMDAPPDKEDVRPFVRIASYLHGRGFSAPAVYACDEARGLLLLEDIGDATFTRLLAASPRAADEEPLYAAAVDVLAAWHDAKGGFSDPQSLPLPVYDEALLLREARLFADWYLPQVVGIEVAAALKEDYMELWHGVLRGASLTTDQFVHRDYHADNLMWLPDRTGDAKVGLLDFQDGVYGDAAYDLVSLLEDARRDVPPALAHAMIERYLARSGAGRDRFLAAYAVLGAQRNCKIVGIFSRLAARDGKHHYLAYLPRVWGHLTRGMAHPALAPLNAWMDTHVEPQWRGEIVIRHDAGALALTA